MKERNKFSQKKNISENSADTVFKRIKTGISEVKNVKMSGKVKRKIRGAVSVALIAAMVCTSVPNLPESLFVSRAEAATGETVTGAAIESDETLSAILKGWNIKNTEKLAVSLTEDADGTRVLTLDQTSTSAKMASDFSTTSIMSYEPGDSTYDFGVDGYTISADIVVDNIYQVSNASGVGIGDTVNDSTASKDYYAFNAFRAGTNARAVYFKSDGSAYGSSNYSSEFEVSTGTKYSYTFKKNISNKNYTQTITETNNATNTTSKSFGSVYSTYFDSEIVKTSKPVLVIEGVKVEVRNLKVLDKDGNELYNMQTIESAGTNTEDRNETEENTDDSVKRLPLDGEEVMYDFRTGKLGVGTTDDGFMTISGETSYNGKDHGANIFTGDKISINVPKGQTTLTFGLCLYGSASAEVKDGDKIIEKINPLRGSTSDNEEKTVIYTSEKDTTIDIEITGGGYLHYIKAKAESVKETATVSGSVAEGANGEIIKFLKNGSQIAETTIEDNAYSVALPIGSSYTVEFANADMYEMTDGNIVDLTKAKANDEVVNNITFNKWDSTKVFSLSIGGTEYTVTPGSKATADFTVKSETTGAVEVATPDTAIVWADLAGNGSGTISEDSITNVSDNITTTFSDNKIVVTYNDTTSNPSSYTLYVKDSSATGNPKQDGMPVVYKFTENSIMAPVSNLHKKGSNYVIKDAVTTTDKLITFAKGVAFNDASHGLAISNGAEISIKVAGNAVIDISNCAYSNANANVTASVILDDEAGTGSITPSDTISSKVSTDGEVTTYTYTGDAATIKLVYTGGSAYIHSLQVTNEAPKAEEKEQEAMPTVKTYGTADNLSVAGVGQKLVLKQSGGALTTVNNAVNNTVSFYGFDETDKTCKLTADVVIEASGASNSNGVFFGAFDGTNIATVGIRNTTNLRGIYSKSSSDMTGAGGINSSVSAKQVVTFTAEKQEDGFVITATPKGEETQTMEFKYNSSSYPIFYSNGSNTSVSYGFIIAGATATVTNMKYYDESGKLVYDQNDCYTAQGTAPVVKSVSGTAADTREYITVNWTDAVAADGDGMYVLQVSKDNGEWEDVATALTDKTYTYEISEAGSYKFRVCGKLGVNGERNTYTESETVEVIAALKTAEVSLETKTDSVVVSWDSIENATSYEVYRYSYDDTAANAVVIAKTSETSYTDSDVVSEMPYYYYVIAYSSDNYSNPSEPVWTVVSNGHAGDYQYENADAGITITKKSYDTVYNNNVVIEGIVEEAGEVSVSVNGTIVDSAKVTARGGFAFDNIEISEGRNDVNLYVTTEDGSITRKTFNFVYLTNYDIIVDADYTGENGATNTSGIPTYKTVQAAVNSVSSTNTERITILVKEGSYNEHLVVKSPYITLIGEDSTKTVIHFYDENESPKGGATDVRCATYVTKTAVGFSAENLTIQNDYEYLGDGTISNESADALRTDAENVSYINVRLVGYQDTLNANQGTQYYYKCYITGNVDFIYGNDPRALFNDCQLVFRYSANKNSGYVCAPRAAEDATYGLTFYNCQVLSEEGCSGSKYYLARPWGAAAYITWINCYMGSIIKANNANPYSNMSGNLATEARFFEFGSYGPGYEINNYRRQISSTMAEKMITASYLTWDPYTAVTNVGNKYVGTIKTEASDKYISTEYETDSYSKTEGDDTGLGKYSQEGYAESAGVTGGGTLYETSANYYTVATAEEFLTALTSVKTKGCASVIELTADIALGSKEVKDFSNYSSVIKEHKLQPLTHPTLMNTGISMLMLNNFSNLTIYSKNGVKITHVCTDISGSNNIIIRNIEFDEIWEWDEETSGGYDRNDWDYITVEKGSSDIWIDHCTFYKAYDGVIDVKTPTSPSNITISWCEFLPGSEDNTFFDVMMNAMKENPSAYPYYSSLIEAGMTDEQIYGYAYGQKKTHLFGQSDSDTTASNIYVTLANNYYKNSMDRMPRLRYGTSHIYNCIMDAQDLREIRAGITDPEEAKKIVSNGASSTCGAHMLLENCSMYGITNALNSGNGDSPAGYINAINTLYFLDGNETELEVGNNNSLQDGKLVQDADEFKSSLPYSDYTLYPADSLSTAVQPYVGAGKLDMTTLQWEKTEYYDSSEPVHYHTWDDGVVTKAATCTETGIKTYTCTECGETKTEIISATGHSFEADWTIDKEATCTEAGSKSHHCTECNEKTDVTEISATGHSFEADWTIDKEATCTEAGSKSHHCTECNEKTDVTEIPATGHAWDDGVVTKAPTCTETGIKTYTCTECGETKTEVIPATGHSFEADWTIDKEATCTEAGSKSHHCTECNEKTDITEIPATGHAWDDGVVTKAATTTEAGVKTYTCKNCGETKTEIIPVIKVDVDNTEDGNKDSNVKFDNTSDEILDKMLTEEEKNLVAEGASIKINLDTKDVSATVNAEVKASIEKVVDNSAAVIKYLDINLFKTVGNKESVQIKETNSSIKIQISIDDSMKNTNPNVKRTYMIIREHEGKVEILPSEYDENTGKLSVNTDKFSIYAITYKDEVLNVEPDNTTQGTTENTTQGTTENTTQGTTENATQGTTENATQGTTENTTQSTTENTTQSTTENTTQSTTENTVANKENVVNNNSSTETESTSITGSTEASSENKAAQSNVTTGDNFSIMWIIALLLSGVVGILCFISFKRKKRA